MVSSVFTNLTTFETSELSIAIGAKTARIYCNIILPFFSIIFLSSSASFSSCSSLNMSQIRALDVSYGFLIILNEGGGVQGVRYFHKDIFPRATSQARDNFSSGNFPKVRLGRALWLGQTLEVSALEITHLGSWHLGNYHLESCHLEKYPWGVALNLPGFVNVRLTHLIFFSSNSTFCTLHSST